MAFKTKDLHKQALKLIKEKKLFFIEDVVAFMPCTKGTFYSHFPIDSDLMAEIKEELDRNKVAVKSSLRKKWYESKNATLQIALMKLGRSLTEEDVCGRLILIPSLNFPAALTATRLSPLDGMNLELPHRSGSSNRVSEDGFVEIRYKEGHLLLMECWDHK